MTPNVDGLAIMETMLPGKRYVVTKASDDGTFLIGDHIILCADGAIECREALGWMAATDVEEAITGMEIAVDHEWVIQKRKRLLAELAALDG